MTPTEPSKLKEAGAERIRLQQDDRREKNWKRWGPYLAERQWGTVREDYSAEGDPWTYFPHAHARSRAYRWGEDGLLGITDRECRLCFALGLWNEKDPILKERLFGLTGPEGNHGEDVKESYFYLDSTPTHSYMRALYKYPQAAFPYARLIEENRRRSRAEPEFEILDTGVFDEDRYWDVFAEYAKAAPDDVLIRITLANRGPETARIHVLPTLWFRNTWSWGRAEQAFRPSIARQDERTLLASHPILGSFRLFVGEGTDGSQPPLLFTENETNLAHLFGVENRAPHVKDAFHELLIHGREDAVSREGKGTKAAAHHVLDVPAGSEARLSLRLSGEREVPAEPLGTSFAETFELRRQECEAFYAAELPPGLSEEEQRIIRQGDAGLLFTKQFYDYVVRDWLEGDPGQPPPAAERLHGRNHDWTLFHARDVLSMPDAWEFPWFAAWDLAFHMIPFARLDPQFAKEQLVLLLREWYMHPNGHMPAYEYAFSDVNPPVHAWAAWRIYKMTGRRGKRDRLFLERVFQKLLLNFTWWVNRKDLAGNNLFAGGFLGLDNIGVFDRSKPLPADVRIEQADGTAWMAFYAATMLAMALELARENPAYEDMASKFFEHFVAIADAINSFGGSGLWDEEDGFYYDQLHVDGTSIPLRVRSMVGLIPLFAVEILDQGLVGRLPGFRKRTRWFLENRPDLARQISILEAKDGSVDRLLLAIPSRDRLRRVLGYLLDEREFLSPYGVRSLSRFHELNPYVFRVAGQEFRVDYAPGEATTGLFGGNSNWRGPVWLPVNFLLVEALERYHHFYGDDFRVELPTGSGRSLNLRQVAAELSSRLTRLFKPGADGMRPVHGRDRRFADDPHFKDLVLFYEYFHGDDGRGAGASHQTGWTALVVKLLEDLAKGRSVG